jgi:hypothetical protein
MSQQGTSTIVQYVRQGDLVTAWHVQRSWYRGAFVETARWLAPGGIAALKREVTYGIAPGPLAYGRRDLIAGGFIKPALHTFDSHPYLSLNP